MSGSLIYVAEAEVYRPGTAGTASYGWMARPRMAPLPPAGVVESTDMLRASDVGYRSRSTDAGGVTVFPPTLQRAFAIDRRLPLHPSSTAAAVAWGTLTLSNLGRRYDAFAATRNSDGRPVRVLAGRRIWDPVRGIELDPPLASLVTVFAGVASPWFLDESALNMPLRDAMALAERPLQQSLYAGTGGREGTSDMAGRRKPKARGGSVALPIRDVAPVWIDRPRGILQISDGPGIVVRLAESGDQSQIAAAGEVPDVFTTTVAPGTWKWSSHSTGLYIRLGSPTNLKITADVVGHFPSGTQASTAAAIARLMLREDLQLPAALVAEDSFASLDAAVPWTAGDYWDGSSDVSAIDAVALFIASLGGRMIPLRDGRLGVFGLRAIPAGAQPVASYGIGQVVTVRPNDRLAQAGLSPPPYRWRVGWGRTNTVMSGSDVDPTLSDDRKTQLAEEYRLAPWFSPALGQAYRKPNDPEPVPTRLLNGGHATGLAEVLGEQWGAAPRLYDVVLPLEIGARREIGNFIRITYPLDNLDGGRLGQIVGEQVSSGDATITFQVLI
jgi:hypothetical protein